MLNSKSGISSGLFLPTFWCSKKGYGTLLHVSQFLILLSLHLILLTGPESKPSSNINLYHPTRQYWWMAWCHVVASAWKFTCPCHVRKTLAGMRYTRYLNLLAKNDCISMCDQRSWELQLLHIWSMIDSTNWPSASWVWSATDCNYGTSSMHWLNLTGINPFFKRLTTNITF